MRKAPVLALAIFGLAAIVTGDPDALAGSPAPSTATSAQRVVTIGYASYYADAHAGRRTASGVKYDPAALVAAHPAHPFGTVLRVTRLDGGRDSGRVVEVRVVDRGPAASARAKGYVVDLSRTAARQLGFLDEGRAKVRLEVIATTTAK